MASLLLLAVALAASDFNFQPVASPGALVPGSTVRGEDGAVASHTSTPVQPPPHAWDSQSRRIISTANDTHDTAHSYSKIRAAPPARLGRSRQEGKA